ncbi:cbb3-type cytochrome oxidase assembly protein CcoS [Marinobacter sp. X15-166B]|uniref:cbb3-type cytochrome oxidase assembly protein CcoS n=1 Tax=Marinobacter sp. X15-166B TaxID=1897620 RepID=UPI00085C6491|nr:cbb3-type cytochrome oxidase assembly protein CcoS [Marinobacter sp. X15-166B]OEY67181.1 cytochrome oxidase maturation protein, cbb3-type [Marinobacter sp. X15-166B]
MEIVMILIPATLILVALGILLFSWAVKNGQYDDLEGPAHRILYDDDAHMIPTESRQETEKPDTPDPDSEQQAPRSGD